MGMEKTPTQLKIEKLEKEVDQIWIDEGRKVFGELGILINDIDANKITILNIGKEIQRIVRRETQRAVFEENKAGDYRGHYFRYTKRHADGGYPDYIVDYNTTKDTAAFVEMDPVLRNGYVLCDQQPKNVLHECHLREIADFIKMLNEK